MASIYISLGSNIDKVNMIIAGLNALQQCFGSLQVSSVFESAAIGFNGDNFLNLVVGITTSKSVENVCAELKAIERVNGRSMTAKKFSSRTLDLDLLLYDDLILETPAQIPRDEITKNAFVLWPLAEIAAELVHPVVQQNYQTLWKNYDKSKQQLKKVAFNWLKMEQTLT